MSFWDEFKRFIEDFNILAGAIAFIIALTANKVVSSLANDIFSPMFTIFVPQANLNQTTVQVGPATLRVGQFATTLLEFVLMMAVIFILVRYALKWEVERVKKK